jgi:hypothetical protein
LLPAGRSRDRTPVGTRFSAPVQTSLGAHPASYTMGTGIFLGIKQLGRGIDHPPPSSVKVKERVELYLYSPSGPLWPVLGWTLPLPFTSLNKAKGQWGTSLPVACLCCRYQNSCFSDWTIVVRYLYRWVCGDYFLCHLFSVWSD